jgi:hypothetical protein
MVPVNLIEPYQIFNTIRNAVGKRIRFYFEEIRNDISMITVDGGSEFKRAFPATMKSIFQIVKLMSHRQNHKRMVAQHTWIQLKKQYVCT